MKQGESILYVINNLNFGGAERVVVDHVNYLHGKGLDVHLLTLLADKDKNFRDKINLPSEKIHTLKLSGFNLTSFLSLWRFIGKNSPKIIVSHLFFSNTLIRVASLFTFQNPKIFIYEHNVYTAEKKQKHLFVDRILSVFTKKIIAVSSSVKDYLITNHIDQSKIIVVENGISYDFISGLEPKENKRKELGLLPGDFVVVSVGNVNPQKGQDVLIRATDILRTEGKIVKIFICGSDDSSFANGLKQLVKEKKLEEQVFFLGSRSDVLSIVNCADIFCMPSIWEGLSIALLEAMGMGKAIVASNIPAISSVVSTDNSLLFTVNNEEDLAKKISKLLSDQDLAIRLGNNAKKTSLDFSIEKNMMAIENLIHTKPRIALMSYSMDNRPAKGTALYTRKLIENLLKDDKYEFSLVHYDKVDDVFYSKVHEIVMPEIRLPYATHFVRQMLFFWKYRKERFDIIHYFQPRLFPFFWFAPARRIVVTAHGAGDITAPSRFVFSRTVFNFIMRNFNTYIDACIAVSNFAKEEIVENYKIAKEKVFVTYNGGGEDYSLMDKKKAKEAIKLKYSIKTSYILSVSRHIPHKNIPNLVRAYIIAREKYDITQDLVVVGHKDSEYKKAFDLAQTSSFSKDIHFIDYVEIEDLNAFYSAADIFVFPSLNEGFGLPVVESMASGTVVVSSNVTSMPEIGADAVLLFNPNDPKDIAEKIYQVLSNTEIMHSLTIKGLKRAQFFTWQKTAEETKVVYDIILAKK